MSKIQNIDDMLKFELEITSKCNAKCPNCARTVFPEAYTEDSMSLDDLKSTFPTERHIKNKLFTLCGQLGDPMMHPDVVEICKYFISNNGFVLINTNGGLRAASVWAELGALSKETNALQVWFCVDGHAKTNSIYRVNTLFDTILRNMTAYVTHGGEAKWELITFDHNIEERDACAAKAKELGIPFEFRTPSSPNLKEMTGPQELAMRFDNYDASTVVCKPLHGSELHITYDMKIVPCCYTYGRSIGRPEIYQAAFNGYEDGWNDLKKHSIEEILQHQYYVNDLEASFDPSNPRHIPTCAGCQNNQGNRNESLRNKK